MSTDYRSDSTTSQLDGVARALHQLTTRYSIDHLTSPGMAAALLRDELGPDVNGRSYRRQIDAVDAAARHGVAKILADDKNASCQELEARLVGLGVDPLDARDSVDAWAVATGRRPLPAPFPKPQPAAQPVNESPRPGADRTGGANEQRIQAAPVTTMPASAPVVSTGTIKHSHKGRRGLVAALMLLTFAVGAVVASNASDCNGHACQTTTTTTMPPTTVSTNTTGQVAPVVPTLADFIRDAQYRGFTCTKADSTTLRHVTDQYDCQPPDHSYWDTYVSSDVSGDAFVAANFQSGSNGTWNSSSGATCGNSYPISFSNGSSGAAYTFSSVDIVGLSYSTHGKGPDLWFPKAACK